MSRLEDLITSIEHMSVDQLLELTRSIRADRRISKGIPRKVSGVKEKKSADKITTLLQSMKPEERAALLAKMGVK